MKRKLMIILISTVIMLSGCGTSEKVITGDKSDGKDSVEAGATNASGESSSSDKISYKGYLFKINNITIAINAEAETYIEALGEPVSYYEAPSCAFGDLDKVYTYSGFELDTYSMGGKDYVSAVVLQDDTVSTAEGVCIGDSADKVKEVYGTPESDEASGIIYRKDDMKLCFVIEDSSVISIQYINTIME